MTVIFIGLLDRRDSFYSIICFVNQIDDAWEVQMLHHQEEGYVIVRFIIDNQNSFVLFVVLPIELILNLSWLDILNL